MKNIVLALLIVTSTAFASDRVGDKVTYDLKVANIALINWEAVANKYEDETKSYVIANAIKIPLLGTENFDFKLYKHLLWTKKRAQIFLASCTAIGGENTSVTMNGRSESACKIAISKFDDGILSVLQDLDLYNPSTDYGSVYVGNFPLFGLAKIETNSVELVLSNYNWGK